LLELNLVGHRLEVFRGPVADAASPFGHRQADHRVLAAGESIAPLEQPDAPITIADLLQQGRRFHAPRGRLAHLLMSGSSCV
jgi:hypothetical protein